MNVDIDFVPKFDFFFDMAQWTSSMHKKAFSDISNAIVL
ncbi:hypothetical protein T10_7769 [Trichinella papuae]|uniref:Uncharacterized protein n=1 Tax=Trichinella papuae TaxID=268474 RepID=A0A0V1LZ56_9BILA|nr:hypothetical protein T10_7769 [Trichinella papuae]